MENIFKKYRLSVYNSNDNEAKIYVQTINEIVNALPSLEKELIEKRYMVVDAEYITDQYVYQLKMEPPISAPFYYKTRKKAFEKIYSKLCVDSEYVIKND